MKTEDMLLIGGGLLAAYILLKPKTAVVTTHPLLPGATATNTTGQLITTSGNLLTNLFGNIFDNSGDTPTPAAPAPTPGAPVSTAAQNAASNDFFGSLFGGDTTSTDNWDEIA